MYEIRVLAFIDILGFSDSIKNTIKNGKEVLKETERISRLLKNINDYLEHEKKHPYAIPTKSKICNQFSDSIVISYLIDDDLGIHQILFDIYLTQLNALSSGFLLRGAVVCDKVYHTEKVIFGPALVRAYELENKVAVYPRIILDDKVNELVNKFNEKYHKDKKSEWLLNNFIKKDFDGQYYLDYFFSLKPDENDVIEEIYIRFAFIKDIINQISNIDNISVHSKYLWLKQKYDDAFENEVNNNMEKYMNEYLPQIKEMFHKAMTEMKIDPSN